MSAIMPGKFHRPVVHHAKSQAHEVERVVLIELPGPPGSLVRKRSARALHVAGGEREQRLLSNRRVVVAGRAPGIPAPFHVVQQAADICGRKLAFERPGGVGIAHRGREVRDIAVHHSLVCHRLRHVHRNTVYHESHPAHHFHDEAGRCHDDVSGEFIARLQQDTRFGEALDMVGDH